MMKILKKLSEPLAYIVLVAAFGFLASMVNHSRNSGPDTDAKLMSYSLEQQLSEMLTGKSDTREISL